MKEGGAEVDRLEKIQEEESDANPEAEGAWLRLRRR
jgi:hypothetical protein